MAAFAFYLVLQFCDFATTAVFLRQGVPEANPFLAAIISRGHPWLALLLMKLIAAGLGWAAWRSGRRRLLHVGNCFFTFCAAWNLIAIAGS